MVKHKELLHRHALWGDADGGVGCHYFRSKIR
jgi:hypothetical protein